MNGKLPNIILIAFFALYLALPLAGRLTTWNQDAVNDYITHEKREPAPMPGAPSTFEDILDYPGRLEAHFQDSFGFRAQALRLGSKAHAALDVSMNPENVLMGRDGWLYLGNHFNLTADYHAGLRPMVAQNATDIATALQLRHDWLEKREIPFFFAMAPDKYTIYPEHLPAWYQSAPEHPLLDLTMDMARNRGVPVLDLRPVLKKAKKNSDIPVYFRTDSHWNEYGAYQGYLALMDLMRTSFPKLKSVQVQNVDAKTRPSQRDLAQMLRLDGIFTDEDILYSTKAPFHPMTGTHFTTGHSGPMTPGDLVHNPSNLVVRNPKALNHMTVLFLRDSFATLMTPFLNQTFSTAIYTHFEGDFGVNPTGLVQKYKPDAVVLMIAERYFEKAQYLHYVFRQDHLTPAEAKETFPTLKQVLYKPTMDQVAKGSCFFNQIENFRVRDGELRFTATGTIPFFELPLVPVNGTSAVVRLDLTAPDATPMLMHFTTTTTNNYHSDRAVVVDLEKGRNIVCVELKNQDPIYKIRLDPGKIPGDYVLHSIEFRR